MSSSPQSSVTTSASTLRPYRFPDSVSIPEPSAFESGPSSPHSRSSPDNSPPDSPSSGSVSSLPSVSSSFFFSSAAASPPHSHSFQLDHSVSQGLIIPSLTLPAALRRSTPYGQTLGALRVLVLVRKGADTSAIPALVLDDNEDIMDVGSWEATEYGRTLKASTDWIEHKDPQGQEKFEPLRNVELIEFPLYDSETDVDELIHAVKSYVQKPFQSVSDVLHPKHRASSVLSNLLSSPCSPLYTALVLLLPLCELMHIHPSKRDDLDTGDTAESPDSLDLRLVHDIGPYIPIIALPIIPKDGDKSLDQSGRTQTPLLSSFRPCTLAALRAGLFRSPETVAQLRSEAADRFMRWREVECAVADICSVRNGVVSPDFSTSGSRTRRQLSSSSWDKARWESEWMPTFSADVAKRLRENTITQHTVEANKFISGFAESGTSEPSLIDSNEPTTESTMRSFASPTTTVPTIPDSPDFPQAAETRYGDVPKACPFAETVPSPVFGRGAMYDPLHLPSLFIFSISLLGPLKERFDGSFSCIWDALEQVPIRIALIGGFVVGVGVGLVIH